MVLMSIIGWIAFLLSFSLACSACSSTPSLSDTLKPCSASQSLSYLHTSAPSITIASPDDFSSKENILTAPCVFLYTFAPWSAHSRHLIHSRKTIQQITEFYSVDIQSRRLAVVVSEISEAPAPDDFAWDFIVDGNYWGSLAVFCNYSMEGMVPVIEHNADSITLAINACLEQLEYDDANVPSGAGMNEHSFKSPK